jgi:hypothetical protein
MSMDKGKDQSDSGADSQGLNQLVSVDQSAIFRAIDDLRHISKYDIDLPRIIVCGDQSVGKSSVLEAISRLNFPSDERTCTTFATELTLDRQEGAGVFVNILWDNPQQGEEEFHPKDTSVDNLCNTINEAKSTMRDRNASNGARFFKDILQIKASNPAWPPLTLVDLPGLVYAVGDEDEDLAREIVITHMSKPKTIILAVVAGSKDPDIQKILKLAQKFDPDGRRTMGIITHPDRIDGSKLKQAWIDIAVNRSEWKFELGWHVVKNRAAGETNSSFSERDRKEKEYFEKSAWMAQLGPDQLGIDSLRVKLSKILEAHSRSALPGIINELNSKLKRCQRNLADLGPSRVTLEDQQMYLMRIGQRFHDITKDAATAQYGGPVGGYAREFFNEPNRRFYAVVKSQNKTFVDWMYGWGHTFEETGLPTNRNSEVLVMASIPKPLQPPEVISRDEFISKVQRIQEEWGGYEVDGTFNPSHLTKLFQAHSSRWREIAQAHLEIVCTLTRKFLLDAADHAAGPGNKYTATTLIKHIIIPDMEKKRELLFNKLEEILQPFEKFPVMTHDPEFVKEKDALYKKPDDGVQSGMANAISAGFNAETQDLVKKRMADYPLPTPEFPSDSSQILDLMKLYYKVRASPFSSESSNSSIIHSKRKRTAQCDNATRKIDLILECASHLHQQHRLTCYLQLSRVPVARALHPSESSRHCPQR